MVTTDYPMYQLISHRILEMIFLIMVQPLGKENMPDVQINMPRAENMIFFAIMIFSVVELSKTG
jgi:hypothetical protein